MALKENEIFINEIKCSKCSKNQKIITNKFYVITNNYLCYRCKGREQLVKEGVYIIHEGNK